MPFLRLDYRALALCALALPACSGSPHALPPGTPTPGPSTTPTPGPGTTPTPTPTPTPGPSGAPTQTPGPTATPIPTSSAAPPITADLTSIVVCSQQPATCPADLDANATSGEEAAVLVKGVLGAFSYSNAGGGAIATVSAQVYATVGAATEYEVFYRAATDAPATDTLTLADAGSHSSLSIPVSIIDPGSDGGSSAFALTASPGALCPGNAVTFTPQHQGDTPIAMTASEPALIHVAPNGSDSFILGLVAAGSSYVTASAGSSTVVYPANIPVAGFSSGC